MDGSVRLSLYLPLASIVAGLALSMAVLVSAVGAQVRGPRPLTPADGAALATIQPEIDAAIDRGVAYLLRQQHRDGSWGYKQALFPTGQTALSAYTLMKSGLPPEHPAVRRAILFIQQVKPRMVYSAGAQLMALAATHDPAHKPRMTLLVDFLRRNQEGSWAYPNAKGEIKALHSDRDISIAQFALLGFRAAQQMDLAVPVKALRAAFDHCLRYQQRPRSVPYRGGKHTTTGHRDLAGFRYRFSVDSAPTGSMTTAGIAAVVVAAECLGKKLGARRRRLLRRAVKDALAWLDHHYTVTANPGLKDWKYYYLYGLERIGSLLRREYIGNHPWYLDGARHLLAEQGEDGAWIEGAHGASSTCFALLFLERATAPTTGGKSRQGHGMVIAEAEDSELGVRVVVGGEDANELGMWITRIDKLTSASAHTGDLRIAKVEYLVDGKLVETKPGRPEQPWRGEAFACKHVVRRSGRYEIQVKVHAVVPAADGRFEHADLYISKAFPVVVDQAFEPWMRSAATAAGSNLLRGIAVTAAASSSDKGHAARLAVDGIESTAWLCDKTDPSPTITLVLSRKIKASTITLTQVGSRRELVGHNDRIQRVEISINRSSKPLLVTMHQDPLVPNVIPLGRAIKIRRLRVRVLQRRPGTTNPGRTGWSEIRLGRE